MCAHGRLTLNLAQLFEGRGEGAPSPRPPVPQPAHGVAGDPGTGAPGVRGRGPACGFRFSLGHLARVGPRTVSVRLSAWLLRD